MKILIFMATVFLSSSLYAQKFKVRAREHFEIHRVSSTAGLETYKGLSNTINLWWEKPYVMSYGFSISPVLSSLKAEDSNSVYGNGIKLFNIGFDFKYFFNDILKNLFLRPSIGWAKLEVDRGDDVSGSFLYMGAGYEYPFNQFGLALEIGYRKTQLAESTSVESFTPSVGFHFYKSM